MSAARERKSRPGSEPQAAKISVGNQIASSIVRCRRCGHALTARASVEREVGPVCAKLRDPA